MGKDPVWPGGFTAGPTPPHRPDRVSDARLWGQSVGRQDRPYVGRRRDVQHIEQNPAHLDVPIIMLLACGIMLTFGFTIACAW